jgi:hypothetical protein
MGADEFPMAELVAVTFASPDPKRDLLLFDRIGWAGAEGFKDWTPPDIQWLMERGLVFDVPVRAMAPSAQWSEAGRIVKESLRRLREQGGQFRIPQEFDDFRQENSAAIARASAIQLRALEGLNAVPIISFWRPLPDEAAARGSPCHRDQSASCPW